MRAPVLRDLPPPPPGRTAWPWTEESDQLPDTRPDGRPWPRISIVTPSFNQGQFLEETIRSVLLQGYPDLEYIVMDGGSRDESVALIRKYEPWLKHWACGRDAGQSDAINCGLRHATGRIVAWVNSDDFYLRDVFAAVACHAPEFDSAPFWLATAVEHFGEESGQSTRIEQPVYSSPADLVPFDHYVQAAGVFWDRSFLREVGELRLDLHHGFDKEFWMRLLARGFRFRADNSIVSAVYRFHDESKSVAARLAFRFDWAKIGLEYAKAAELDRAAVRELRSQLVYSAARIAQDIRLPRRRRARYLAESLRRNPAAIARRDWRGGALALLRQSE